LAARIALDVTISTTYGTYNRRNDVTLINLLAWVYRDQRAQDMSHISLALKEQEEDHFERHKRSQDGCAQLLADRRLGATIPGTESQQRLVLHPDAECVHERLAELSSDDPYGALLVFRHARRGIIPDYSNEIPIPQPVLTLDNRGRERVVKTLCKAGDGDLAYRRIMDPETGKFRMGWIEIGYPYCPITYWPSATSVIESRLDYRLWHNALTQLLPTIPPLRQWEISGIGAESQPWGWANDNIPPVDR